MSWGRGTALKGILLGQVADRHNIIGTWKSGLTEEVTILIPIDTDVRMDEG